jgi:4-hydroxybenzoate polyprenyltransferase
MVSGYIAGFSAFFFVLVFTALYYIYSANPSRLKLIPFFSSFLIALCCLSAVLAGFFLLSPVKNLSVFPDKLAGAVVLLYFLFANIRDMKDIEGDKKAHVMTVPLLFGDVWGPRVVGGMAALAFLLVPVFVGIYSLFVSAVPAAAAIYFYITRKPYAEKPVFNTYFSFIVGSIIVLLI